MKSGKGNSHRSESLTEDFCSYTFPICSLNCHLFGTSAVELVRWFHLEGPLESNYILWYSSPASTGTIRWVLDIKVRLILFCSLFRFITL